MAKILDIIKSLLPTLESQPSLSSIPAIGPAWLFGALGTIAISLYGLSLGRTRAVMSLLALYTAFAFDRTFPYFNEIQKIAGNGIQEYWIRIGVFIFTYVLIY